MVLAVALFWVLVFALNRLYSVRRWPVRQEVVGVIYAVSTGMMLVFTVIFFRREIFESRFIVLVAWGLAMAFVILARLFLRLAHRWLVSRGFGQHRVILIGPEEEAAPLVNEFKRKPGLGFFVMGVRAAVTQETLSWILRQKTHGGVDEVILAHPHAHRQESLDLMTFCEQNHINFFYTAGLFEAATSRLEPHTFAGIPLRSSAHRSMAGGESINGSLISSPRSCSSSSLLPSNLLSPSFSCAERQGGILFRKLPNGHPAQRVGEGGAIYVPRSVP